jgi:hypothetical protein
MKKALLAFTLLASGLLTGCGGATIGTIHASVDKDITLADVQAIHPGMAETDVIKRLGRPASYGLDDAGRFYLAYKADSTSLKSVTAIVPFAGGSGTSSALHGFEAKIQITNHQVVTVAYKVYGAPKQQASAG